jgi:hypothetical protein
MGINIKPSQNDGLENTYLTLRKYVCVFFIE